MFWLQDQPEDVTSIDSCEYIWEAGVGFAQSPAANAVYESHRTEILKLILTCFSQTIYQPPIGLFSFQYSLIGTKHENPVALSADAQAQPNQWIAFFTSTENRHALPLFTSLLNIVCAYDPVGYGVPYNHLMFNDAREPLVEIALQVLSAPTSPMLATFQVLLNAFISL